MVVRFENLIEKWSKVRNLNERKFIKIRKSGVCYIDGVAYSVRNIIDFTNHKTVLIEPIDKLSDAEFERQHRGRFDSNDEK